MNISNDQDKSSADESAREIGFAENFTYAAREIHLNENKNPNRIRCFTSEYIRRMSNSGKLPDDSVLNHIFDCSECFREYRQALLISRETNKMEKSGWYGLFTTARTAKLVFSSAGLVLMIGLVFLLFWIFRGKQSPELAKTIEISNELVNIEKPKVKTDEKIDPAENKSAQTNVGKLENIHRADNSPAKNQQSEIVSNQKRQARPESVTLILSLNNILRNAADLSKTGEIVLPARKIDLNIKLTENFSDGLYKLKIVDAFGNGLFERNLFVKKSKLSLKGLNLRNLEKRASKICLQIGDEIPDCFDIKIAK